MASTSTNKQPLLIDRVFNNVMTTNNLASGSADSVNVLNNTSAVLVDCTTNDGGIVEDMWAISRSAANSYTAMFYLSSAVDYLRSSEAVYVGEINIPSSTAVGTFISVFALPKVLAPVPYVGTDPKNQAFYVPTGKALWVTLQRVAPDGSDSTPIVGAQGGFY